MTQKLPKNRLFRILFPVLYGSVLYILILLVFENFNAAFESFFNSEWMFTVILSYLTSELLHQISWFLSNKLTFANKIAKYIISQLVTTIIAEILLVYIAIHFYFTMVEGFSVYSTELTVFELFYVFSALLYNLFIFSYLFLNEESTIQYEQETEFKRKNDFLLQSVHNDIDPDVLYAAMESLLVYINKDERIAADIINKLSLHYRYRLENKFNELITVNEERNVLENLVQLFNYIHSGSIEYEFNEDPNENESLIMPVWLQKIILSVFKCNIISPIDKFKISINLKDNSLILKHSWREKLLLSEANEINKISGNFEFYTKRKIDIHNDNEWVTLTIPIFLPNIEDDEEMDKN